MDDDDDDDEFLFQKHAGEQRISCAFRCAPFWTTGPFLESGHVNALVVPTGGISRAPTGFRRPSRLMVRVRSVGRLWRPSSRAVASAAASCKHPHPVVAAGVTNPRRHEPCLQISCFAPAHDDTFERAGDWAVMKALGRVEVESVGGCHRTAYVIGLEGLAFLIIALLQLRIEEPKIAVDILRHREKADLCLPQFPVVLEHSAQCAAHAPSPLRVWRHGRIRRACRC